MISKIKNWFKKEEKLPFTIVEVDVPEQIHILSKNYPILHTVANNRAVGEVRKFNFQKENTLRLGQAMIIHEPFGLTCTWVHLGNDFFKLVMKA